MIVRKRNANVVVIRLILVTLLLSNCKMTFVDDEIEKINQQKIQNAIKGAKKHQKKEGDEKIQQRAMPPVPYITSIISAVYSLNYPFVSEVNENTKIEARPAKLTQVLDVIIKQAQSEKQRNGKGKEASEQELKNIAASAVNILKELDALRFVLAIENDNGEEELFITRKAVAYLNSVTYLLDPKVDPYMQSYLLYNQLSTID